MIFRIIFLFLFIGIDSYAFAKFDSSREMSQKSNEIKTAEELLSLLPHDKFLGSRKAPVLIIEYASLTCYHCSLFHKEVFPIVKKRYIDTGKVLYIFRHFPLDYRGLKAAMLSYCYSEVEDYFNFNKAVFNSIDLWNYHDLSDLTVLKRIAALSNLQQDMFSQCIDEKKNKEVFDKIISDKSLAIDKLGIMATPIFFIDLNIKNKAYKEPSKIKHEGYKTLEYFTGIIDELYERHMK